MKKSVNLGSVISFQMSYSVSLVSQPLYFNFTTAKWEWITSLFLKIRTVGLNNTPLPSIVKILAFNELLHAQESQGTETFIAVSSRKSTPLITYML